MIAQKKFSTLIMIFIAVYMLLGWQSCNFKVIQYIDNPLYNTTIGSYHQTKYRDTKIIYEVSGVKYIKPLGQGEYGLVPGELFVVYYLKSDPNNYWVDASRPMFERKENVKTTTGKIIKVNWNGGDRNRSTYLFAYRYQVEDAIYERYQYIDRNLNRETFRYKRGDSIPVIYWEPNPQRSAGIVFDSVGMFIFDEADFIKIEKGPYFPGGEDSLYKYLSEVIRYPECALKDSISGIVYIQFVVLKDGNISEVQIQKGIDPCVDTLVFNAIKNSPKWEPGVYKGKPIRVLKVLPVQFKPD